MKKEITYKAINEILLEEWNPIESDNLPKDEYSGYVSVIYLKIKNGTNIIVLSNLLMELEETSLGVNPIRERCNNTAEKLLKINL